MSLSRHRPRRSTRPARRRVGGGWLSLFAMWMIFIGPLVSQSMPMNHHAGMSMSMPMPMSMAGTMDMSMADAPGPGAHAGHGAGHDGQLHVLWEKCGYCSLLFNCPALPQTLSPLTLGPVPPPLHLAARVRTGHGREAFFPGARSRAPPLLSIV
ncbi:DUF2946 domain-containing protein [Pseudomonas sp. RP23018S]|uniref:DUF2946 domain-containing protein n=1 Tax=Pseudomonas sp. RP23018S TaxID=3096037 RepID=UPI002ACAC743|nr:DUF2946 domain-containing protein [Pseudomonas sp. RP23018S]MDZ5604487.1 DUF2946 domain-containing protein [Pseudomonas sp. RP23018S]